MNCKIDTFMRNYIIFIMTFFASNMTLLLSSKSFIRHSLKSNKDLNVNFSRNFQIGVLSTYFDQPSKLLKSWIIYTHFNFSGNFGSTIANQNIFNVLFSFGDAIPDFKEDKASKWPLHDSAQIVARPTKPT